MGIVLNVAKISNIFFGMLGIPDIIFGVNSSCWVQIYIARKI